MYKKAGYRLVDAEPPVPGASRSSSAPPLSARPLRRRGRAQVGGSSRRRRIRAAWTPAVIDCVAMIAKRTSTWAVAACTALPPPA